MIVSEMATEPCEGCAVCPHREGWIERRAKNPMRGMQAGGYVPAARPAGPALILAIGEAPGMEEAQEGRGFVGKSGGFLRSLMVQAGLDPETEVAWANTIACRPHENSTPKPNAIACCAPLLSAVLTSTPCRVVLAVGRVALNRLLGSALVSALVSSRSTWDGYVFEWGEGNEVSAQVVIGQGHRYVGEVYKSKTKLHAKGEPKLSAVTLRATVPRPPGCLGIVACLHPSGVQRKALVNTEQLLAALVVARRLASGEPIYRGPSHVITDPGQWPVGAPCAG